MHTIMKCKIHGKLKNWAKTNTHDWECECESKRGETYARKIMYREIDYG